MQGDQDPGPGQPPPAAGTVELAPDQPPRARANREQAADEVTGAQPQLDQLEKSEQRERTCRGTPAPAASVLEGELGSSGVTELACGDRLGDLELGPQRAHVGVLGEALDTGGDPQRVERVPGECETHRACRFVGEPGVGVRGRGRTSARPPRSRPTARRGPPRGPPGSSRTARAASTGASSARCSRAASGVVDARLPVPGEPGRHRAQDAQATPSGSAGLRIRDRALHRRQGVEEAVPVHEQSAPGELQQRGGVRTPDLRRDPCQRSGRSRRRRRRRSRSSRSRPAGGAPRRVRRRPASARSPPCRRPCSPATGPRGRAARATARATVAPARPAAPRAPGCAPRTTHRSRSRRRTGRAPRPPVNRSPASQRPVRASASP